MRWNKRIPTIAVITIVVVLSGWMLTYPSEYDPKNLQYVLWKFGLFNLNLDIATETMVGDSKHDQLVIGKTQGELQRKFGYLLELNQAAPYYRSCLKSSSWKDEKIMFLRKSNWMVVFENNKASNLVLIKGC